MASRSYLCSRDVFWLGAQASKCCVSRVVGFGMLQSPGFRILRFRVEAAGEEFAVRQAVVNRRTRVHIDWLRLPTICKES